MSRLFLQLGSIVLLSIGIGIGFATGTKEEKVVRPKPKYQIGNILRLQVNDVRVVVVNTYEGPEYLVRYANYRGNLTLVRLQEYELRLEGDEDNE